VTIFGFGGGLIILGFFFAVCVDAGGLSAVLPLRHFGKMLRGEDGQD
jgi:hypothetical protein